MRHGVVQHRRNLKGSALLLGLLLLVEGCHGDFTVGGGESDRCKTGEVQCVGNVLQQCNDAGMGWDNQAVCASETLCDSAQKTCLQPTCAAGERRCVGAEAQLCNGTRDGWTTAQTCPSAGSCNGETGSCTAEPCEPGALQCNGAVLRSCSVDRLSWNELATCDSPGLCSKDLGGCATSVCQVGDFHCEGPQLQTCSATLDRWTTLQICDSDILCDRVTGTCGTGACSTPGVFRCTKAGGLERCADDLTGWLAVSICQAQAYCDAANGVCSTMPCASGARQCSGETLEVCNAERTAWDAAVSCETDGLCQLTLAAGASTCTPPVCDLGKTQCDQAQPQICNAARTGFKPNGAACASTELCNAGTGTCTEPICNLGQTRCNGAQPEICHPALTGYVPNGPACASAALCNGALGTCGNQVCVAGQLRCDPSSPTHLQRCNDDLTDWQPEPCDICDTAELCGASLGTLTCDASSCQEPVCDAGEPHCGGNGTDLGKVLEVCNSGRTGHTPCQTCVTPELCDLSRMTTPFTCKSTACTPPSCSTSDRWCGGSGNLSLYQCPASRINTQATVLDTCATSGLCELTHQKGATTCEEPSCALTDRWCGGSGNLSLHQCPASRINAEATVLDTCKSSALCELAHEAGESTCQPPACTAGMTQCGGSGNSILQRCKSDLTGFMDCDICSSAALCADSLGTTSCTSSSCRVCSEGDVRCNASEDYETCKSDGSGFTVTDCMDYGCDEAYGCL